MADFSSPAYKRSRAAYVAQSTFEYFITLVVADAFLAKLLTSLGVSDAMAGIIASFVSLVFVVQIFSILLVKGRMGSRSLSMIFETLSQLCFASIYFIPFLPVSREAKHMIVILAILFAYVSKYLVYSILFKWGNSFVENSRRGRFSALREMVSLFGGIVFTLVVSRVFDSYEASGNLSGGFLFIAIVILVCTLSSLVSMLLMKPESTVEEQSDKKSLRDVMRNTLGNPHFRRLLVFAVLWECAKYFTVGFLAELRVMMELIGVELEESAKHQFGDVGILHLKELGSLQHVFRALLAHKVDAYAIDLAAVGGSSGKADVIGVEFTVGDDRDHQLLLIAEA